MTADRMTDVARLADALPHEANCTGPDDSWCQATRRARASNLLPVVDAIADERGRQRAVTPWAPPLLVTPQRDVTITPQQANVLTGLCRGWTFDRIAREAFVTRNTAVTHARRLYAVLGATSRAHAVALACTGQVRVLVAR